jgi:hypothetical protein
MNFGLVSLAAPQAASSCACLISDRHKERCRWRRTLGEGHLAAAPYRAGKQLAQSSVEYIIEFN